MTERPVTVKITATPTYTQIRAAALLIVPLCYQAVSLEMFWGMLANYTVPIKLFNCTVGFPIQDPRYKDTLMLCTEKKKSSAVLQHTLYVTFHHTVLFPSYLHCFIFANVPYRQVCRIYLIGSPLLSFSSSLLKFSVCPILWIFVSHLSAEVEIYTFYRR